MLWPRAALVLGAGIVALVASACGAPGGGDRGVIQVVAAENMWGNLAGQLGGSQVSVTSIVTDPNADPHEYQSSTNDARAFATADYVILNGAGYDDWAQKLLDASPSSQRRVLNIADLLGKHAGDNPHFWYSPPYVRTVIDRISADYAHIAPDVASTFAGDRSALLNALQPWHQALTAIAQQFDGRPVAATESIFVYMAQALRLNLVSPAAFMDAVSEGNEPPAASVAAFSQQLAQKQVVLLVYNAQTATAVTTQVVDQARSVGIPVVPITETLQPPSVSFQQWQLSELETLQGALARAPQ